VCAPGASAPCCRHAYTEPTAHEVRETLDPLIIKKSLLSQPIKKSQATW
jgi:hypothetical protein